VDDIDKAQQHDRMYQDIALQEHYRKRQDYVERGHGCIMSPGECRSPGLHPKGAGPGQTRPCRDCGEEIEPARLQAMPGAIRCIECQKIQERRKRHD